MVDMTTTGAAGRDAFAAWLAVLVDTLDEPNLGGDEVAARVHLSRFHLDRVVSAIAGETAAALRRRVLLERAAHRLATSPDTGVVDVAVEAGYGSHEAFTRAFRRAYGRTPSAWRERPGILRLEGASGVHFTPPSGIRLPAQQRVTAMDLLQSMVAHHVWLTGRIADEASRLTDAQLDEPIVVGIDDDPDPSTLRTLVSRLVGQMAMWNARMAGEDYDWSLEERESMTSARRRLADAAPVFVGHVREAVEQGRLDDVFVDAECDPPRTCTYGAMVAHVLTFAAHRRTLAVRALDHHGVGALGWGDPIDWVDAPAATR
ncbi:AraC family transcriptional regulator [Terracoccus luteus]|uniref:AraC family transcriptional regulator n=2 Tax=Terracoccus luteus TaxID=53356 RepID=A0A495Y1M8_9MICO|nr:AraC family transcriptional regulator [Terracoccus luteus]